MQSTTNYIVDAGNTCPYNSGQKSGPFPAKIISPTHQADLQE